MKIKAIIFDQDETLIHPNTGLYEVYVTERAKDFARVFDINNLNEAKRLAFEMKISQCDDSTISLYDRMGIPRSVWYDKLNAIDVRAFLHTNEKLKTFIMALKNSGIRIILLTNSPSLQTKKVLNSVGVPSSMFDHIFTWEKGQEPPKPSKEPFLFIWEKFGLTAEECLMVGNEVKVDLQVAHTLHIHTVGIHLETKADENVDFIIHKLEDIFNVIKKIERNNI